MKTTQPLPRWLSGLVLVTVLVALWWNLGLQAAVNVNEVLRLLPAAEMLETGDWIVPRIRGEVYLNKPPLVYWLIAPAYALAGDVNPLAARVPVTLAALLTVAGTAYVARRHGCAELAAWAAVTLAGAVFFVQKAQEAEIDPVLTGAVLGCGYGYWRAVREAAWWRPALAAGGWAGLALLLKGPVLVPFLLAMAGAAWWVERPAWRRLLAVLGVVTGVGVALFLPWGVLVLQQLGVDYVWRILWEQALVRVGRATEINSGPWYFYLKQIGAGFLPWTWLLALWLSRDFRAYLRERQWTLVSYSGAVALLSLVLFSAIRGKETEYLLPIFPLLALNAGAGLVWLTQASRTHRAVRIVLVVLAVWAVLGVLSPLAYLSRLGRWAAWLSGSTLLAGGGAVLCAAVLPALYRDRRRAAVALLALGLVGVLHGVQDARKRRFNERDSVWPLAPALEACQAQGRPVVCYRVGLLGEYTLRDETTRLPDDADIIAALNDHVRVAVVTRRKNKTPLTEQLNAEPQLQYSVVAESRRYLLLEVQRKSGP